MFQLVNLLVSFLKRSKQALVFLNYDHKKILECFIKAIGKWETNFYNNLSREYDSRFSVVQNPTRNPQPREQCVHTDTVGSCFTREQDRTGLVPSSVDRVLTFAVLLFV
jgi:hypothetical protein